MGTKKLLLILIGFVAIILLLNSLNKKQKTTSLEEKNTSEQSAFSKAIEEENKKQEETRKKEEEKKRQEEETRKFIVANGPCRFVPVLMYHHVDNKKGSLYVSPEIFENQMNYLMQKGYTTVTLSDVIESLTVGKILPPKPIVITFDDGYRDIYFYAYPVLRKNNQKATIFVITQLVEGSDYLTWEQLRELAGNSLITLGNHTLSHRSLISITPSEVRNEIVSANNILQENLGITVKTFAYPYGSFNGEAESVLRESGFIAAVTTNYGLTCAKLPLEIPRVRVGKSQLSAYGL